MWHRRDALLFFKAIRQISRSHGTKKLPILTQFGCFQTVTPGFEFTDGYEMMHKAWSKIEEMPYCFSWSSVEFQGHTAKQSPILTWIECFRAVTPVWIHRQLWNDAQSLKGHGRGTLLFSEVICQISRSCRPKNQRVHGVGSVCSMLCSG